MEKFGVRDVKRDSVVAARESMALSASIPAITKTEAPDFSHLVEKNKLLRGESVDLIDKLEKFVKNP